MLPGVQQYLQKMANLNPSGFSLHRALYNHLRQMTDAHSARQVASCEGWIQALAQVPEMKPWTGLDSRCAF